MELKLKRAILFAGNDNRLAYLLQRFSEQAGWLMQPVSSPLSIEELTQKQPLAVIFDTIDQLRQSHSLVDALVRLDIPVLVCASLADEGTAGELGADACLLHPLTFDQFQTVLTAVCPLGTN